MKRGWAICINNAYIMTKSPVVIVPADMAFEASNKFVTIPATKINYYPIFR